MELHIIYTESAMLVSKERFSSWRAIQDRYLDFKSSLGPWEAEAVIAYLSDEYADLMPAASIQIDALLRSEAATCVLTFQ